MNVPELDQKNHNRSRAMTWNRLKDYLPVIGYTVTSKRKKIKGKQVQCYFITGEWHDVEIKDNDFLTLVAAKTGDEE